MRFSDLDAELVELWLRDSWSPLTSSHWSAENPARGQCGVTTLVINDFFGGEILKTRVGPWWHFYNRIDGQRVDFTSRQFRRPVEYSDLVSSREEALAHVREEHYAELGRRFSAAMSRGLQARGITRASPSALAARRLG